MRLIDADALKKLWCEDCDNKHFCNEEIYCDSVKQLYEQPTVDAIKRGHWENKQIPYDVPHTIARCSVCKGKVVVYAEDYIVKYPYCPLCGAKMDEVKDDSNR